MNDALLRLLLILIALVTAISGLIQIILPGMVLAFLTPSSDELHRQLFATVGMFMLVTGSLFLQGLWNRTPGKALPFWIGVQKLLAAVFVTRGVYVGVFMPMAIGVASFDALSAFLCFIFAKRIAR
jgi:hypothetical protein